MCRGPLPGPYARTRDDKIEKLIRRHFDLRPYGHFGRTSFEHACHREENQGGKMVKRSETSTALSWEKTDKAEELRKAAGIQ